MADRHAGYVVALDKNLSHEAADRTLQAIGMISGVISVEPVVGDVNLMLVAARHRRELATALLEFMEGK